MTAEEDALQFLRMGRLAEAEQLYLEIAKVELGNAAARYFLGIIRYQQGRPAEALEFIAASLALDANPNAFASQGNILQALARFDDALASYDHALKLTPDFADAWFNRGVTLANLKRPEEALASYDKALDLAPGDAAAWANRGTLLLEMDRAEEALESVERSLAITTEFAEVWNSLGIVLQALGRTDQALGAYDKALVMALDYAQARMNRGVLLQTLGRLDEALTSYDKALAINPDYAEALANRSDILTHLRRLPEALAGVEKILALTPSDARAWKSRGAVLSDMGRMDEALASFDQALALQPDYADALYRRGNLLWAVKRDLAAGIRDLESALKADPEHPYLRGDLLHLKMQAADWRGCGEAIAAIDAGVRAGKRVIQPLYFLAISDSPAAVQACSRIYTDHIYPPLPSPWVHKSRAPGKIRLGYLCGNFRVHPTGFLMAGLIERHDKSKFQVIAFDLNGKEESPIRKRFAAAFDKFLDVSRLADDALAEKIHAEGIDILVDMHGHTRDHRMGALARKPAPLQVELLGFPSTVGAPYMDYVIGDGVVIPEQDRRFYTEAVAQLPDTYWPTDGGLEMPSEIPSRAECGLPEEAFVFCDFNQLYKLTPAIFAVWMRILRLVPGSVLWLLENNSICSANLRREAVAHGVAESRLVFALSTSQEKHMARLKLADLCIDTLPYNAHTTTSDALWMGVPMVTCLGDAFAGRVAASLLYAMNMPELVTDSLEAYEALILSLAADPARLAEVRRKLEAQRGTAALFDTDRYRRNLEAAFAAMWDRFQQGLAPQSFAVNGEKS